MVTAATKEPSKMTIEELGEALQAAYEEKDLYLSSEEDLSEQEKSEYDDLCSNIDELEKALDKKTEQAENKAKQSRLAGRIALLNTRTGRMTDAAGAPAVHVSRPITIKAPLNVFRGKDEDGTSARQRAYNAGMWAASMLAQQLPKRYKGKFFDEAHAYAQDNLAHYTVDDNGSDIFIPTEFSQDLINLRLRYGVVRNLFDSETMGSDLKKVPRRVSGATAYFEGEGADVTTFDLSHDMVSLVAKKLRATTLRSRELDQDAIANFGDRILDEIAYAFAVKEDTVGFTGTGLSTDGGIQGVNTKLQDVDGAGTDSFGLNTGAGNLWTELVEQDFLDTIALLPDYGDTDDTVWVMHRTFYWSTVVPLILASGGTTISERMEFRGRTMHGYLGYPVLFSNAYPSAAANSSVVATLGDFKMGAIFAERESMSVEVSDTATVGTAEATQINCWENEMIAVKGRQRIDMNVHDVGSSTEAGPIVGLQTAAS